MGSIKQSAMFSALSKLSGLVRPFNSLRFARNQSTLVLVEHNNEKVNPVTLNAITAARALGGEVKCLVAGTSCGGVAKEVSSVEGISKVLVAEDAAFEGFMPEKLTPLLMASQNQFKFTHIIAGASAFSRGSCQGWQLSWMSPPSLTSSASRTVTHSSEPSMQGTQS